MNVTTYIVKTQQGPHIEWINFASGSFKQFNPKTAKINQSGLFWCCGLQVKSGVILVLEVKLDWYAKYVSNMTLKERTIIMAKYSTTNLIYLKYWKKRNKLKRIIKEALKTDLYKNSEWATYYSW